MTDQAGLMCHLLCHCQGNFTVRHFGVERHQANSVSGHVIRCSQTIKAWFSSGCLEVLMWSREKLLSTPADLKSAFKASICHPYLPSTPLQNERGLLQSGSVMGLERELGGDFPWNSGKTEVSVFLAVILWLTHSCLCSFWLQPKKKEQKSPYEYLFHWLYPSPNTRSSPVVPLHCGHLVRLELHFPEPTSLHWSLLELAAGKICMRFGRQRWNSSHFYTMQLHVSQTVLQWICWPTFWSQDKARSIDSLFSLALLLQILQVLG